MLTVWETSQPGTHLDQISLTEGRFRWQHDQVLAQLAEGVEKERKLKNTKLLVKGPGFISFLKPGEKADKEAGYAGIFATETDWEMRVDLGRQLKFPEEIAPPPHQPLT